MLRNNLFNEAIKYFDKAFGLLSNWKKCKNSQLYLEELWLMKSSWNLALLSQKYQSKILSCIFFEKVCAFINLMESPIEENLKTLKIA